MVYSPLPSLLLQLNSLLQTVLQNSCELYNAADVAMGVKSGGESSGDGSEGAVLGLGQFWLLRVVPTLMAGFLLTPSSLILKNSAPAQVLWVSTSTVKTGVSSHILFQNSWLNSVLFLSPALVSPCSPALPGDWSSPAAFTIGYHCVLLAQDL